MRKERWNLIGLLISFALFAVSMVFAEKHEFLTLTGILGLGSFMYFIYRFFAVKK